MNILARNIIFVSNFGDFYIIPVTLFAGIELYLFFFGHKKEAILVVLAAASYIFSVVLKLMFKTARPEGYISKFGLMANQYGFPSSHTLFYFAFWGFILYLCITRNFIPVPIKVIFSALSLYFISLVGLSRIYMGAHSVIDVVGGYSFGILYLAILIVLDKIVKIEG